MRAWILFVMVLGLSILGRAQERIAHVQLENGTEVTGRVVLMDLKQLQLVVDDEIVTIPAGDIKTCRFENKPGAEPPATPPETPPETPPAPPPAAPAGEVAPPAAPATTDPVGEPAAADPDSPAAESPPAATATQTAPAAIVAPMPPRKASSKLDSRIAAVEAVYPWLRPTDPFQWFSLGLLLFSGLSLIIHISAVVAGAEAPAFGRSVGLALAYMVAAVSQIALVPANDFGVFAMLIGNTALVLFSLRLSFKMARSSTFVAFAVQAGLMVVGFGILELIDSLLGSVAAA